MIEENITVTGQVELILTDESGKVKDYRFIPNLVVTVGKSFLASAIISSSTSPFTVLALGTGTTPAAASDTTLQTELVRAAFNTSSAVSNVTTVSTTFAAGVGTGAITEAGVFNNTVGGSMFARVVFSVVNKGAADGLTVTWSWTIN